MKPYKVSLHVRHNLTGQSAALTFAALATDPEDALNAVNLEYDLSGVTITESLAARQFTAAYWLPNRSENPICPIRR